MSVHEDTAGEKTGAERGSALLMAIFALVFLTAMGVALLFLTRGEVTLSQADLQAKQAFFLAEAAIEEARLHLFAVNGKGSFNDDLDRAYGTDLVLGLDPATLSPAFDAAGRVTAFTGYGDDVPLRGLQAFGAAQGVSGWFAAFLTNDPTELASRTDTNDRVMITGIGVGPGRSTEVVQAILERRFLTPPAPPAAITMLGPNPDFQGGSSGAKSYSGDDCGGSGTPGLHVPTIGVIGSAARSTVSSVLANGGTYRSGSYTGGSTVADLTDGSHPLISGPPNPAWTDCQELRAMVAEIRRRADVVCTNNSCPLPPPAPDRIVFVDGNYDAPDGQGMLVVTRKLQVQGNWNWNGMVLVVGTGEMRRAGGGNGTISGGIVIADIAGPDRTLFTADDCSEGPDGFGETLFHTSGGGNSLLTYCQASLSAVRIPLPYNVIGFRQR